jgi:hypothetical protein
VIGLLMHWIYRKEEVAKSEAQMAMPTPEVRRPLWKMSLYFASMVGILVFANWARSGDVRAVFLCCPNGLSTLKVEGSLVEQNNTTVTVKDTAGRVHQIPSEQLKDMMPVEKNVVYETILQFKWTIVFLLLAVFIVMVYRWFDGGERIAWVDASWGYAKLILPLLLVGVLISGLLLGRPGREGLIPSEWVNAALGGNSLRANFFAAIAGAFMYFATLTEVPIIQGLLGSGMGKGPALALLLAGPALSLPSMLVIRSVIGTQKTIVYVSLVVIMATITGIIFGTVVG